MKNIISSIFHLSRFINFMLALKTHKIPTSLQILMCERFINFFVFVKIEYDNIIFFHYVS